MKISPARLPHLLLAKLLLLPLFLSWPVIAPAQAMPAGVSQIAQNDVVWTTLGRDENDSMPIGNGDLAANVWTETNGDLVLLVAKADAWTETGKLVKLGRVRFRLNPNPFVRSATFSQTLRLEDASIVVKGGASTIRVWADANHPVIHVETHLEHPGNLQAGLELWRPLSPVSDARRRPDYSPAMTGLKVPRPEPDMLFPAGPQSLTWCHFNPDSYYPYVLRQEHLESLLGKFTDPLWHRCFGATLTGAGLVSRDDHTLQSALPAPDFRVDFIALTQPQADSASAWRTNLDALKGSIQALGFTAGRPAHEQWWQDFWERSWIHVSGSAAADKVSQGYALQRYMMAAQSRGELPVKFNGGLFTVGHDLPAGMKASNTNHDADYRAWGDCYWNQNNRLLYWPLIASGDTDLLRPWFDMYLKALPLARERTRLYYHHDGASFPETMHFWGVPRLADFGTDNPSNEIQSHWQRYHIQGTLEVIAQMLDVYDGNGDDDFARTSLVPFADAIVTYYQQHWPRDAAGKIRMAPTQSLESYQLIAVNPTPDIAGLMSVVPRLLALPPTLTTEAQRTNWRQLLNDLPPIPLGRTAHGKLPPLGIGDADGRPTILPAEHYGKPGNSENPEMYVAFPYRLFGVGKPGLALARDTFAARRSPQNTCWGQDGTQAAILGLTAVAAQAAVSEFSNYGNQRFRWFWRPAHDWIPDFDNGGDGMITLQLMLLQCDGQRIQLLPAWPADWTADFKLHAPHATTVEGHVEHGQLTRLVVTPASRTKDVVITN